LDAFDAEIAVEDAEWEHIKTYGQTSAEKAEEDARIEAEINAVSSWKPIEEEYNSATTKLGKWFEEAPLKLADALGADDQLESLKKWRHEARQVATLGDAPGEDDVFAIEAAMYLLDPRYGQTTRSEARFAMIENQKKFIIQEIIPQLNEVQRRAFLKDALPFICFPLLQAIPAALMRLNDISATRALDQLPNTAFNSLPKHIKLYVCAHSESRCRRTVAQFMNDWAKHSVPTLRAALHARRSLSSAIRRKDNDSLKQLTQFALAQNLLLFDRVVQIISDAFFAAQTHNEWCLWSTLLTDLVLEIGSEVKNVSANSLRRVAFVSDSALQAGKWDPATLSKLSTAVSRGEAAVQPISDTTNRGVKRPATELEHSKTKSKPVQEDLHSRLEEVWTCLTKADPQHFFAFPVSDEIAPGYSRIIKEPMDLGTMRSKIGRYKSVNEFEIDVKKIVDNCKKFNGSVGPFSNQATKLWKAWLKAKQTILGLEVVDPIHTISKKNKQTPLLSAVSARRTDDHGLFRLACRLLLAEPFAEALALKGLIEEMNDAVITSQLPAQRKRCRDLVAYLSLVYSARTGLKSDPNLDLHLHLPRLQLELVNASRQQEQRSRKKQEVRSNLLAALTEDDAHDNKMADEDHHDPLQPVSDLMRKIASSSNGEDATANFGLALKRLVSLAGNAADWFSSPPAP